MVASAHSSYAAELNPQALRSWESYVASAKQERLNGAELLGSSDDGQKFSILWVQRVLFVTAAFYTELDSDYVVLNS